MKKINAAIIGYGNIGKYVLQALQVAEDFSVVGVVRRDTKKEQPPELQNIPVEENIFVLGDVDVAILACPSRLVGDMAVPLLEAGICTVDSFDIHSEICSLRKRLGQAAEKGNSTAVLSAGWDPGSDSVVRMLMQAMAPRGITETNFGPGMSMGHTVAVKALPGVIDALSVTIPIGTGLHRRMVYIKKDDSFSEETITSAVKQDAYFIHDETHVIFVDDVKTLKDMGHGVRMNRKGVSGITDNQLLSFAMNINNPALTAQILVAAARAAMKTPKGAYTLPEIPIIDLLPGDREVWIDKFC